MLARRARALAFARRQLGIAERDQDLAARRIVGGDGRVERVQRPCIVAGRFLVGEEPGRALRRRDAVAYGAAGVACGRALRKVVRERREMRIEIGATRLLDDLADAPVQADAQRRRQIVVQRLAHEGVGEGIAADAVGRGGEDPGLRGLVEQLEDAIGGCLGDAREDVDAELAPDHRRRA